MNARAANPPETRFHVRRTVVTAKDIAEAIAFKRDRQGFSKALRQVKHWTDKGLLRTITPLDTGSGVAREYSDDHTILISAILQELVLLGCTIEQLTPVAERLYDDFENGDPDDVEFAALTDEFRGYLVLEFEVDARGHLKLERIHTFNTNPYDNEATDKKLPRARSSILLDLGSIADRIAFPGVKRQEDQK
jgi:hypothetical protein